MPKQTTMTNEHWLTAKFPDDTLALTFEYKNYRGVISARIAKPIAVRFGASPWHDTPQWLMRALDLEKKEEREFAMRDMRYVTICKAE